MKICRFGAINHEKPGLWHDDFIFDISREITDWQPNTIGNKELIARLSTISIDLLPSYQRDDIRVACPLTNVGKLICIGFNSRLHAEQFGLTVNEQHQPYVFLKATSALCGAYDPVPYTFNMSKLDWEGELAIIIGRRGKYIPESNAQDYIFGYSCFNDLSERYWQLESGDSQYTRGKSFDNFAPLGPFIACKNEITDPNNLHAVLKINGQIRQDFCTSDYIYNTYKIVSYLSNFFTLYPGDIIAMGSPPGNAKAWNSAWLQPSDCMEFSIVGLGQQKQLIEIERTN